MSALSDRGEGFDLQGRSGRHRRGAHGEDHIAVVQRAVWRDAAGERVTRRIRERLELNSVERRVGRDHGDGRVARQATRICERRSAFREIALAVDE